MTQNPVPVSLRPLAVLCATLERVAKRIELTHETAASIEEAAEYTYYRFNKVRELREYLYALD